MVTLISSDDWLDLRYVGQRSSTFRWDVLDSTNTVIGSGGVHPVLTQAPSIANDTTQAVKRTLTNFVLTPSEQAAINPFADRIRPTMILPNGEEFPLGVFLFVQGTRAPHSYGKVFTGSLMDQTWPVNQGTDRGVGLAPGASIHDAIVAQLALVPGIAPVTVDAFSTLTGGPAYWPAGTLRLKIINDLCAMAGCYDLYFDNTGLEGHVRLVPPDLTAVVPTVTYVDGTPGAGGGLGNIVEGSTIETDNLIAAPNRFVVIDNAAQGAPIVGVYDIPSSAPNSFHERGEYIVQVINENSLPSIGAAVTRAATAAAQSAADISWWSFQGVIDPRHDTYDILSVRGQLAREQKWSIQGVQEGANMNHDVRLTYAA